jgi:hypothetical protein
MNQEEMREKVAERYFWITSNAAKVDSNGYFLVLFLCTRYVSGNILTATFFLS